VVENNKEANTMAQRKMPVRTKEISLNGEWEGWSFTARTNPPMGIISDMSSGEIDLITESIARVITDWNFVDEEGEPLPIPKDIRDEDGLLIQKAVEIVRLIPIDLLTVVSQAYSEEVAKLSPN
jgi:hypothetical protein